MAEEHYYLLERAIMVAFFVLRIHYIFISNCCARWGSRRIKSEAPRNVS